MIAQVVFDSIMPKKDYEILKYYLIWEKYLIGQE